MRKSRPTKVKSFDQGQIHVCLCGRPPQFPSGVPAGHPGMPLPPPPRAADPGRLLPETPITLCSVQANPPVLLLAWGQLGKPVRQIRVGRASPPWVCPPTARGPRLTGVLTFCRLCPRKSSSAWLCTETSSAWNHVQMRCA